ncbi:MAG: polysaccharide pyruvyl transferase family protein, partial [Mycobacteriales bacterium]
MNPLSTNATAAVRVLVDQSGYDLRNLGDVAMLQSCVRRLQVLLPDADIGVFCHDAALLAMFCPGAIPVAVTRRKRATGSGRLRSLRLAMAQLWKIVGPYTVRSSGRRSSADAPPRGWREALRWADIVVASGGGYVTDTWWWHGSAVLSVLHAAQRMDKPTAMFGQGLGPLTRRLLRRQARAVLPGLAVLSLRGVTGDPLARELGVKPDALVVTGDDALEMVDGDLPRLGDAVGVNVRVSGYSGVDEATADVVGE